MDRKLLQASCSIGTVGTLATATTLRRDPVSGVTLELSLGPEVVFDDDLLPRPALLPEPRRLFRDAPAREAISA